MLQRKRWIVVLLVVFGLQLIVYQQWSESAAKKNGPAKIERLEEGISRITLTPKAAERLDIQTTTVREEMVNSKGRNGAAMQSRKIVPYSAVLYDPQGNTWTYTSPKPLVFVRHLINVEYIKGDQAILLEGPPVGTEVVTVGVAELYGVETGIGK